MAYQDKYKDFIWIDFDILENFMIDVLKQLGVPENDAKIVADILIKSDKLGIDSHGIGRFKPIYIDRIDAGILNTETKIDIIRDNKATAVIDGNNGMGMVISKKAMQMAIDKAKEHGMGMVAVRNSTHYGIAGYYTLMAVENNMVGITGSNTRPSVAPTFGVEGILGTNPLTISFPTDEEFPFFLDCATSVTQRGKIEAYARANKEIPEGWVIGEDGNYRTDTHQILKDFITGKAATLPLGGAGEEGSGYKGYGYATFVEVMSAALQGGAFLKALSGFDEKGNKIPYPLGHFFMAIDINAFTEPEEFKKISGQIMRDIRNSKKAPGAERIYTPGEKEHIAWQYRKNHGCPIPKVLQKEMSKLRDRFKLDYKFEWDE